MAEIRNLKVGATKTCPTCKTTIPVGAKKCPNCQSDLRSWFRRHPIITLLLILFGLPFVMVSLLEGGGNTSSPTTKLEQPTTINAGQREKASWEIADDILAEQKAKSAETQRQLKTLLEAGRYQEAKGLLIGRQEDIVSAMLEIRKNENLTNSDKERVLKPMASEADGLAKQVKILVGSGIDELLRSLE